MDINKEKMYSLEEVRNKTLEYFKGDELACNVWIDKYCLKNDNGEFIEDSPLMMCDRLAKEFVRIESKYPNPLSYDDIYHLLKEQIILPGGSLLFGIGNDYSISSLGNCFVIGNNSDSYGGICQTDQEQAQLMKRRAGVGHDISHLRPANSKVTNAAGTSTGAVSFMHRFSNTTREVAQNGRRGALMLTMDINHPDIEQFIESKGDLTKITGANISVKMDDDFMNLIDNREELEFKKANNSPFKLWDKLIHQAWKSAEPGMLFWDTIVNESPADCYEGFKSTSTNPCGEIPLCPYDSCRLLAINLTKYVKYPFTDKAEFDLEQFKHDVYIAQKIMDDVVDLEEEKINKILDKIVNDIEPASVKLVEWELWRKIKDKLLEGRRTGLSGIGLADTLAMLNIKYSEGIDFAESIYKNLALSAYKSNIDMAKERGSFPIWQWNTEKNNVFIQRVINYTEIQTDYLAFGRRNIACLTIPPSGTISLLAGISSGIEPVYQLSYKRRRKVNPNHPNVSFIDKNGDCWEEYVVLHPGFEKWMIYWENEIANSRGTGSSKTPYDKSTAYELNPIDRIKMQAGIQKWIDHSISSTVNLHKEITEEQVSDIYIQAWKLGCKGITIYRDGCRDGVLVSLDNKRETKFHYHDAPKRLKDMPCDIFTIKLHNQNYVVAIGLLNNKPYEVFSFKFDDKFRVTKGFIRKISRGRYDILTEDKQTYSKDITSEMSQVEESTTRLVSTSLRHGADIKFLVEQLLKARGNGFQDFSKVIARVLKKYIKDETVVTGVTCNNCGSTDIIYKDGCQECNSCGNSKCS